MSFWNKQDPVSPNEPTTRPPPSPAGPPVPPVPATATVPPAEERVTAPPARSADAPVAAAGDLLLGAGAEFEGKLRFQGTVRIDARFKGSITTNDVLVVGEHARIDAEITCGTVIVHGEVNGNVKATTAVQLHYPAKVRGDVETPSLVLEKGVVLHGHVKMTDLDSPARTSRAASK
jgi:cytoskeletal protein CcmA (bactofilin family)